MNRVLFIFMLIFSPLALGEIAKEELIGVWYTVPTYAKGGPKNKLVINADYSAEYLGDDLHLQCPKEGFSQANGIYQIRCYLGTEERVRFSLGGWGKVVMFGFEFWVGGITAGEIHGGAPVSFNKNGIKLRGK